MNSVHEQCPNSDSETVLSPKTGSKLSQVHCAPNLAQPTRARVPYRGSPSRLCRGLAWLCRKPGGRVAARPSAVSWPCLAVSWPCVATQPVASCPFACHNTPQCIATHFPTKPALLSRYTNVYCDPNPASSAKPIACHDTI